MWMTGNEEIRTPLRSYTVDVDSKGSSVTSTGSRRPAFARLHTSVGMSPTWSACRCVRNTLVAAVTGRCGSLKLASEPDPRSKKQKSRSGLPTSMSTEADSCAVLYPVSAARTSVA
jgi:hypothetical protein